MQFGKLTLKHCRYGWMLFTGRHIGKCFELYGEFSESEVSMMRNFVRPGDTAIDVGANIGDLTLPLSRMVGDGGRIVAVEPNPEFFNVLCGNLALNQISNTMPVNKFIRSDENAEAGDAFAASVFQPGSIRLDDFNLESCRLIKIDVDGQELNVIKSGQGLISDCRPVIYFENDVKERSHDLLDYMLKLDYELYWHKAPIFSTDNFFGNPDNFWTGENVISIMILGVPAEWKLSLGGLEKISDPNVWWQ